MGVKSRLQWTSQRNLLIGPSKPLGLDFVSAFCALVAGSFQWSSLTQHSSSNSSSSNSDSSLLIH